VPNGLRVAVDDGRTRQTAWRPAFARLPAGGIICSKGWLQHTRASRCLQGLQTATLTAEIADSSIARTPQARAVVKCESSCSALSPVRAAGAGGGDSARRDHGSAAPHFGLVVQLLP
jgi:hypothetical protein